MGSIVPQDDVQVAGTFAVNDWDAPSATVGVRGEIISAGTAPMVSTTLVVYAFPEDAVAVIVQAPPAATEAVKRPPAVMLPQLAAQVTGALAVNCCVRPSAVLALAGEMVMGEVTVAVVDAELAAP